MRIGKLPVILAAAMAAVCPLLGETTLLGMIPRYAEFSDSLQKIVIASAVPNQLHLFDPVTHADQVVDLPGIPNALSVSPDGHFAAVGLDQKLLYIDLRTATQLREFSTAFSVADVVLTATHVLYSSSSPWSNPGSGMFPVSGGAEIATGQLVPGGRVNPRDGSILANAHRLQRLTLSGDTIHAETQSAGLPFPAGGAVLGFLSNPERIVTAGGVRGPWPDPQHLVTLPSQGISMAHRPGSPYFAYVSRDRYLESISNDFSLAIFDSRTLRALARIPLAPFPILDGYYGPLAEGAWVFAADSPGRFYVIAHEDRGGTRDRYQLETIDLDAPTPACTARLVDFEAAIDAGANRGSLAATTSGSCVLRVESQSPWLEIQTTSQFAEIDEIPGSGHWIQGEGKISWIARDNPTGAPRTGTILIGGETFTVTQAAARSALPVRRVAQAVIAAAYSRPLDRLILLSDQPPEIAIIDPVTAETRIVTLDRPPASLVLLPGETTAFVCQDGMATYIDLAAAALLRSVPTGFPCSAASIAPNGGVLLNLPYPLQMVMRHSRPENDVFEEQQLPGFFFSISSLLPARDGRTLYTISGPRILSRYDLSGDQPLFTGSSSACEDGWLSQDGASLLTSCYTLYPVTPELPSPLGPVSRLAGLPQIRAADHSLRQRAWAYASSVAPPVIGALDDLTQSALLTLPTPVVDPSNRNYQSSPRFTFWAENPTRLIAVVHDFQSGRQPRGPVFGYYTVPIGAPNPECSVTLSPAAVTASFAETSTGTLSVSAPAGCLWEAVSDAPWVTIRGGTVGGSSGSIAYAVDANPGYTPRAASIRAGGSTITVSQPGGSVHIAPLRTTVHIAGLDEGQFQVIPPSAEHTWSAKSQAPWISLLGPAAGQGSGVVRYAVAPNPGPMARTGQILIGEIVFEVIQTNTYAAPERLVVTGYGERPTFSWNAVPGEPPYYRLMVASSRANLPDDIAAVTCANCLFNREVAGTSYTLSESDPAVVSFVGTLYWRVNARNGSFTGEWSAASAFRIRSELEPEVVVVRLPNGELASHRRGDAIIRRSGGALAGDPGVARDPATGTLWVAARDAYDGLWLNRLTPAGEWGSWRPLGGVVAGTPAVGVSYRGDVVIAIRDRYNAYWLVVVDQEGTMRPWIPLGGVFASDPALVVRSSAATLVGRDPWGGLWSLYRAIDGGASRGWQFGGGITVGKPAAAYEPASLLTIVAARDAAGMTWRTSVASEGGWGTWSSTGGLTHSDPILGVVAGASSSVSIVIQDPYGAVWVQQSGGKWTPSGGIVTSLTALFPSWELLLAGIDPEGNLWWNRNGEWLKFVTLESGHGPIAGPQ